MLRSTASLAVLLFLIAPFLAAAAAAAVNPATVVACYEGYATPRGSQAVRHYALICDEANGKARLDVYLNTALLRSERFRLEVRVDADTGTTPGAASETWIIEGEESMRFATARHGMKPSAVAYPAAGGGDVGQWNFFALRRYG